VSADFSAAAKKKAKKKEAAHEKDRISARCADEIAQPGFDGSSSIAQKHGPGSTG